MFVTRETKRYEHPSEPGAWVEMRLPPAAGDLRGVNAAEGEIAASLQLLSRVIVAWSDPRPVSLDAINELDAKTLDWLADILRDAMGIGVEEKKASGSPSSPTSSTGAASPVSSAT